MFDSDNLHAPSAYLRMLLQSRDETPESLLAGTGLSVDYLNTHDHISLGDLFGILRNIADLDRSGEWALNLGDALGITSHGPLGFAALSAPSLGAGLEVFTQFVRIRAPYISLLGREENDKFCISLTELYELGNLRPYLHEVVALVLQAYVEQLLGHTMREAHICFGFKKPKHTKYFANHINSSFDFKPSQATTISIPLSWTHLPSPLHDEATYRNSLAECKELLAAITHDNNTTSKVENVLSVHFDRVLSGATTEEPPPTITDVAAALNTTSRTLIRKLKIENNGYRQILENQRKQAAQVLLGNARYTVSDVADKLGYRDAANFGRAFKKWYGASPAQYRRR